MSLVDIANQSHQWPQKGEGDEAPRSVILDGPAAQQFTGLCIGGPYDGMKTTHFMNVLTLPAIADLPSQEDRKVAVELHLFNYVHVNLPVPSAPVARGITRNYGFWVPKGKGLIWALEELAEVYVNSGGSVPK
ncbi:hypothetical protein [Mesorhizobium sp. M8A.F.Ca.ET.021.01.1.1]|uniref:hypothetical protein n=1 Tax=Mesorhizobium sp. M8A.F.Ca.ET.021.01.1.1 TaxID=2496757 RepID=UPI000FCA2FAC|nr:hypothetical protein [Mesorhizobium sp. M8A.F.Ca.ET.021.01.1.1]RUW57126.1 hypothetical protein EOA36_00655 [Mesorhizobium sp. M8A.F.Ca.ET.021.01.1.1]